MLTPLDLKDNYQKANPKYDYIPWYHMFLADVTEEDQFTQQQWDNLVKVCSVIDANQNRLYMKAWHDDEISVCGTTHCIAGWAVSLEKNDTNTQSRDVIDILEKYDFCHMDISGVAAAAAAMMSTYVVPFFYIIYPGKDADGVLMSAEDLVMKYLIRPVLDEAKRDSYQLSQEVQEFIDIAKRETCHVS